MGIETKTTYVCDRCYTESSKRDFRKGDQMGVGSLGLKGQRGSREGGGNFDIDMLLCFECCDEVIQFLRSCKKRG